MNVLTWRDAQSPPETAALDDVLSQPAATYALVWIDLVKPDSATMDRVAQRFGLQPLAVQQILKGFRGTGVKKLGDHVFITWHTAPEQRARGGQGAHGELHMVLGKGLLITAAARELKEVAEAREELLSGQDRFEPEPAWVLHQILNKSVTAYNGCLDEITAEADKLEEAMLSNPRQKDLEALLDVKHRLLALRKTVARERDATGLIAALQNDLISRDTAFYLQDLHSGLLTLIDDLDTTRDILAGSMDIYLSSVSNRLNEIVKRLTVVATVVLPATLITSFFGMNNLPAEWTGTGALVRASFLVGVVLMLGLGIGLWVYSRRQGWW